MSGLLPSFLAAAQLEIRIGSTVMAFAQNCAWTDDMTNTPVGGIGSYSHQALEPTAYIGRGSMTVTHYSSKILDVLKNIPGAIPATAGKSVAGRDGNSLLITEFFNPIKLLVSRTFDIVVYERFGAETTAATDKTAATVTDISPGTTKVYTLKDCRMTNLSFTFTPGTLVNQVASFLCRFVIDHTAEDGFKYVNTPPTP